MNSNILLFIVGIVLLCNVISGYKKGMVREVISFVSMIILCIIIALIGGGLQSYFDGQFLNVIIMVVLLCVVGIVKHLLDVVFFSAKVLSKLPIVSWLNKILGIAVGVLETVLILWTIYTFVMMMDLGVIEEMILDNTRENQVLAWFYQHNYLAYLLEQVSSEISF